MMVQYLAVAGFQNGILVKFNSASCTFEHIAVSNQSLCGITVTANVVSFRDVRSTNVVPAVCQSSGVNSFITLVDGFFQTPAHVSSPQPAIAVFWGSITNPSLSFFRNVVTHGYAQALFDGYCGVPPPPLPPTSCANASVLSNTAGNGQQLTQAAVADPSICCNQCQAWTMANPDRPCVLWSFGPETGQGNLCWLHASNSSYARPGTVC